MAGEELDLRADIGPGRMDKSLWVGVATGKGYADNWDCKAGGLRGICGNEGARGGRAGEGVGKGGNWGTGGGGSMNRLLSPMVDLARGRTAPGMSVFGRGGGWEYLCGNCWLTTVGYSVGALYGLC